MKSEFLQRYRAILINQRDELLLRLNRHAHIPSTSVGTEERDPADQANVATDRNLTSNIATSEDHLLEKIETALQRTEDGTYGICTDCGADIPEERLLAKASVSLCVPCQTLKEESM